MGRKEVQRCRWPVGAGSTLAGLRETWLRGGDLNPRPLGYEPNELPDCSTPRHYKRLILTQNAHEANDPVVALASTPPIEANGRHSLHQRTPGRFRFRISWKKRFNPQLLQRNVLRRADGHDRAEHPQLDR